MHILLIRGFRIYANGGTCAQIAGNQPDLFVVYGGSITRKFLDLQI